MKNENTIHRFTATIRAERTRRHKEGNRTIETIEEVEACIQIDLNMADIAWDLGASAVQNANGKAGKMRGAIKAKILSETINNRRERTW